MRSVVVFCTLIISIFGLKDRYDYIVIGAGPGGSALGRRLAETGKDVLVLERGLNVSTISDDIYLKIPRFSTALFTTPPAKRYVTEGTAGVLKREIEFYQGEALGGSTGINGLYGIRGAKTEYDEWRNVYGLKDWGYFGILPYLVRLENNSRSDSTGSILGHTGPVLLTDDAEFGVYNGAFISTLSRYPYKNIPNNNNISTSPIPIGVGYPQKTVDRKRSRIIASEVYLQNTGFPNLQVIPNSWVIRINFDDGDHGLKTRGVEAIVDGEYVTPKLKSGGEVILSSGAIETPKLLMLSGIGPLDALQAVDVTPIKIVDNVGRNLHDQPGVTTINVGAVTEPTSQITYDLDPVLLAEWTFNGSGIYAQGGAPTTAFYSSGLNGAEKDTQIVLPDAFAPYTQLPSSAYGLQCFNVRPYSRGRITLRSKSPFINPIISPNYFNDSRDILVLTNCLRVLHNISSNTAISPLANVTLENLVPGDAVFDFPEPILEIVLQTFVQENSIPGYHFAGSVAMSYALDANLQIPGIAGLRVADNSVVPRALGNNPSLSIYAIGEKAAVLIKKDLYADTRYRSLLTVTSICKGRWQVSNPNDKEAVFDWVALRSSDSTEFASGQFSVNAGSNSVIYTNELGADVDRLNLQVFLYGDLQRSVSNSNCF